MSALTNRNSSRGFVAILPLLLIAVVVLAGWALLSKSGVKLSKPENVLGAQTESVGETYEVIAQREHKVLGISVNTPVHNIVSVETGEVVYIKPTLSDRLVSLLSH